MTPPLLNIPFPVRFADCGDDKTFRWIKFSDSVMYGFEVLKFSSFFKSWEKVNCKF